MATNELESGGDTAVVTDPSQFSFRERRFVQPFSQRNQRLAEMDQAQQRYIAGINAGYSEKESEALYRLPTEQKWKALDSVPDSLKAGAAKDLDEAHIAFLEAVNSGYDTNTANKMYYAPKVDKWTAAAGAPDENNFVAEKVGAIQELESGYDPQQVLQGHPKEIFSDPKFMHEFQATAKQVQARNQREDEADADKSSVPPDPMKEMEHLKQLYSLKGTPAFDASAPEPIRVKLNELIGAAENQATNPPVPVQNPYLRAPSYSFNPDKMTADRPAPKYLTKFKTQDEVLAAFSNKELSRDEAKKILQDQFGAP